MKRGNIKILIFWYFQILFGSGAGHFQSETHKKLQYFLRKSLYKQGKNHFFFFKCSDWEPDIAD